MTPAINQRPLPYIKRLQCRRPDNVRLAVVHCTELPDLASAREWGERVVYADSQTGNSGHFYIDRDGAIEQWVPLNRSAHHVKGHNADSVGIELVNQGRFPDWFHSSKQHMQEPYPALQIMALAALLNWLTEPLPGLLWVSGHADIDIDLVPATDRPEIMVRRKLDPGPQFPWPKLLADIPLLRQVTWPP